MSTEEIYYWRGMAKANLEDWDGAAQDSAAGAFAESNFLAAGQELKRIHSLGLAASPDDSANPLMADLLSESKILFLNNCWFIRILLKTDAVQANQFKHRFNAMLAMAVTWRWNSQMPATITAVTKNLDGFWNDQYNINDLWNER